MSLSSWLLPPVKKGGPGSGPHPSGRNQELPTFHERSPHPFVHAFLGEHTTGEKAGKYLRTVSDEKLRTAASLLHGYADSSSGLVRSYVEREATRRGISLQR
jgi:hypothetical protein